MLSSCFSTSSQASQDQQLRDGKGVSKAVVRVSKAVAGVSCHAGCRLLPLGPRAACAGLGAEAVEGQ